MPLTSIVKDMTRFAEKYLDFLITDHGFTKTSYVLSGDYLHFVEKTPNHWWRPNTYYIRYRKEKIKMEFSVAIDTNETPNAKYYRRSHSGKQAYCFALDSLEPITPVMRRICSRRNVWVGKRIASRSHLDPFYLEKDYEQYCKHELDMCIKDYAGMIMRHPKILEGDITEFPKGQMRVVD